MSIQDTIRRLSHAGKFVDLHENSYFVRYTDALLSLDRERLDEALSATRKVLSDWAGRELDNWWGALLSVGRLPGVEDTGEFIGDASYVERIESFMRAAHKGISLESVRLAAQAGAGVEMRISLAGGRVLLEPVEPLDFYQREGALSAARRLAPAKAVIEIGEAESPISERPKHFHSDSVYIGEEPSEKISGPAFVSENYAQHTTSRSWISAPEGSLFPGSGLPSEIMSGGAWHSPELGFGGRATLEIAAQNEPLNMLSLSLSEGDWYLDLTTDDGEVYRGRIVVRSGFAQEKIRFPFVRSRRYYLTLVNNDQRRNDFFLKDLYLGAEITSENRIDWLAAGGKTGDGVRRPVVAEAGDILSGGEWISSPAPNPTHERVLYATLAEVPKRVQSLGFKTRTPNVTFEIAYSNDQILEDGDYDKARWQRVPGSYVMKNGRVKVKPFVARHIRLTITDLRPMMMRDYPEED